MATTQAALIERLNAELGLELPEGTELCRTYAGENQRRCGAWSWFADTHDLRTGTIGSQTPMGQLARAPRLVATKEEHGHTEIDPATE